MRRLRDAFPRHPDRGQRSDRFWDGTGANSCAPPGSIGGRSVKRVRVAHVASVDLTHRFLLLGQLRRLRDEGMDVTAVSAPGHWVADLEAEGIRHLPWEGITRAWSPVGD